MALWLEYEGMRVGGGNGRRGSRRPSGRWGCRSIPLRHGQSRSYTTNPSASLFLSPYFALPRPSRRYPLVRSRYAATLPPLLPCLSSSLSLALTWYARTIANGLQPLPGIYPRNLPERPSNFAASSRVRAHPTYPSGSLEGIYRLRAL